MVKTEFGYLDPLRVESIDSKNWKYLERFRLQGSEGDIFEIEAGETTDFATVPWWTQAVTPRTGTWTKAAGVHDKMCNLLNKYYKLMQEYRLFVDAGWSTQELTVPIQPAFSSIDTDAVFRKNARMEGTGPIRAELLWLGVRYGALKNPARRGGWLKTAPRVALDSAVVIGLLVGVVTLVSKVWPW